MSGRATVRIVHLTAGIVAFLTILAFWSATVVSELSGDHAAVAAVKQGILWGMIVLVPAMAAVGGSGFRLGRGSRSPVVAVKRRRMAAVAVNGLLILVPSAVFLAGRATAGDFGAAFVWVQAIELAAGAANMVLLGFNMRDGFRLRSGRHPEPPRGHESTAATSSTETNSCPGRSTAAM